MVLREDLTTKQPDAPWISWSADTSWDKANVVHDRGTFWASKLIRGSTVQKQKVNQGDRKSKGLCTGNLP